jgi:hypothetical protein
MEYSFLKDDTSGAVRTALKIAEDCRQPSAETTYVAGQIDGAVLRISVGCTCNSHQPDG